MRDVELSKGDKVIFLTLGGKVEGKVVEVYENDYIKVRYGGIISSKKVISKSLVYDFKRKRKEDE